MCSRMVSQLSARRRFGSRIFAARVPRVTSIAGIWLPGNVLPTAGNTYEVTAGGNPSRIRNPTYGGSTLTFPGDSLQLNTNTEIRGKTATTPTTINFPGVGGNPGLILNGGNLD